MRKSTPCGATTVPAQREVLGLWMPGAMTQQRSREEHLAWLCDEGMVDVLDGALLVREYARDRASGAAGHIHWRTLQNLPRTAALPETVWDGLCHQLQRRHPGDPRPGGSEPTDRPTRALLVGDTSSLIDPLRLLSTFAAPLAPGDTALIALLDADLHLDYDDLFHGRSE